MLKFLKTILFFVVILFPFSGIFAYVAGSSSYQLGADSMNSGGGTSTSTNYSTDGSIGQLSSGLSSSSTYNFNAGYVQQMNSASLTLAIGPNNIVLPSVSGFNGGTGDSTGSITVTTNNSAGYSVKVKALTDPALKSSSGNYSFTNYNSGSSVPTYNWNIASNTSSFGFTPEGTNISSVFRDDGTSSCGTGNNDTTNACWYYFPTTDKEIVNANNAVADDMTNVKFRYQVGTARMQESGTYVSTIVVTAMMN